MADLNGWETEEEEEDESRRVTPRHSASSSRADLNGWETEEEEEDESRRRVTPRHSASSRGEGASLSAAERMRLATEERERGRAAAIAASSSSSSSSSSATSAEEPNPFITGDEALEKAKRNAPGINLISQQIDGGRALSNKIKKLTEKYNNNPHVIFEMETIVKDYKILSLALRYLDRGLDINNGETRRERNAREVIVEDILALRRERRDLIGMGMDSIEREHRKKWMVPFKPIPIELPDITRDCLGEKNSILGEPLIPGKCVRLSDGRCYNFHDIIELYKSANDKLNLTSPYTRAKFTKKDLDIILSLIHQGHTGGKRTRRNHKMRKTRVR